MNPNSQCQVNLTTQSSSSENSSNDYGGTHFFNGCGGRNSGRGGVGRGRFADVQCQICYKFGHVTSFCYHRLKENYVPTLPPTTSLAPAFAQTASTQFVQWTSIIPAQQVQYAQPVQYIIPSLHGNAQPYIVVVQHQLADIQPPLQTNHQVSQQQANPQVYLTSSSVPSQNWYPDSSASHHVTNMS